jgi:oligopeptide transport system substrate-binding protein
MTRKSSLFILLINISCLLFFCSCTIHNKNTRGEKYGGALRINANDVADIVFPGQVLKASEHLIISQVYCGLLKYNPKTFDIESSLAKNWSFSDEGLTIRFTLQDNAFFHDDPCFSDGKGRKIVASDIKYSVEKIALHHYLSKHELSYQLKNIVGSNALIKEPFNEADFHFSGIQVINDSVVEFKLIESDELFLHFMASTNSLVFPKEAFEKYGYKSTVGSGPYTFNYADIKGHAITLVANPNYFGVNRQKERLPFIDTIVVSFITSPSKELQLFEMGLLDLVLNISESHVSSFLEKNITFFQTESPKYIMKQTTGANNKINVSFVSSNLHGLYLNSQGYFDFSEMYFKSHSWK